MWKPIKLSRVSEKNPADFVKHEEEIPKMADSTCPEGVGPNCRSLSKINSVLGSLGSLLVITCLK